MEKHRQNALTIVFALLLVLAGISHLEHFGNGKQSESANQDRQTQVARQRNRAALAGTINDSNQLVDNQSKAYDLGDTEKSLEVKTLTGRRVELTGTLMEKNGQPTIEVKDYKILK